MLKLWGSVTTLPPSCACGSSSSSSSNSSQSSWKTTEDKMAEEFWDEPVLVGTLLVMLLPLLGSELPAASSWAAASPRRRPRRCWGWMLIFSGMNSWDCLLPFILVSFESATLALVVCLDILSCREVEVDMPYNEILLLFGGPGSLPLLGAGGADLCFVLL